MGERGSWSQVSVERMIKCVCECVKSSISREPSFPFYRLREKASYMRERRRKRKTEEKGPRDCVSLLLLRAGPTGLVVTPLVYGYTHMMSSSHSASLVMVMWYGPRPSLTEAV